MGQLRFITGGESHGAALTAIIDGLPAGLQLSRAELDAQLARRQRGYGRGGRMKIETDRVLVLSGLRFGETIGSPITLQVVNRDFANWTDRMDPFGTPNGGRVTAVRPGHVSRGNRPFLLSHGRPYEGGPALCRTSENPRAGEARTHRRRAHGIPGRHGERPFDGQGRHARPRRPFSRERAD